MDTLGSAFTANSVAHRLGTWILAELRLQIGAPVHTLWRDGRIETVGPPVNVEIDFGPHCHHLRNAALADEAPRTNGVGNDVDIHCARLRLQPDRRKH